MHIFFVETHYQLVNALQLILNKDMKNVLFILDELNIKEKDIANRLKELDFVLDVIFFNNITFLQRDLRAYKRGVDVSFSEALQNYFKKKLFKIIRKINKRLTLKLFFDIDLSKYKDYKVENIVSYKRQIYPYLLEYFDIKNIKHLYLDDGLGSYVLDFNNKDGFQKEEFYLRNPKITNKDNYIGIDIFDLGLFSKKNETYLKLLDFIFDYKHIDNNDNIVFFDQYETTHNIKEELAEKRKILAILNQSLKDASLDIKYKMHPSLKDDPFKRYDFLNKDNLFTDNVKVPAELKQLRTKDKRVYITFYSTAAISPALFNEDEKDVLIVCLYKLLPNSIKDQYTFLDELNKFIKLSGGENILTPTTFEELQDNILKVKDFLQK